LCTQQALHYNKSACVIVFFTWKPKIKFTFFETFFFSSLKEVLMPTLRFLAFNKKKSFNRNFVQTNFKTFWWKIFFNSSTSYLDSINVFYFYFFSISTNSLNEKPFLSNWKPNLFELSLKESTYLKVLMLQ
jgi:hypothetical protein